MWGKKSNENTEIQKNQNQVNKADNNYSWDAEVIHGNAATGEQVWIKREVKADVPIDDEAMKKNWEEMDKEAEKLKQDYPGQVISAISYQDEVGNQIIRLTPSKELIFPVGVPIYDENGNKIIGLNNIRGEIERRREEWAKWEREGKLSEHVEIHHTDDGKTVRVKFRAAPKRLHPNEIRSETEWFINNETQRWEGRQNRSSIENSQELSEENSNFLAGDTNNKSKKPRMEEKGNTLPMEVDKQENSPTEPIIKLLTDDEIKIASEDEIVSLIERLSKELESRKDGGKATSSSFQRFTTQEIENQISKFQSSLESFQTSNTNANNDDKSSNVGGILAVFGVVGAFAIGGVAFVKSKLSNKKK